MHLALIEEPYQDHKYYVMAGEDYREAVARQFAAISVNDGQQP